MNIKSNEEMNWLGAGFLESENPVNSHPPVCSLNLLDIQVVVDVQPSEQEVNWSELFS